ncbi:MAG: DoxX family protein [Rhodothermales bacterium]|nr:DoxX family protein [Rhodothermales bacterium]
MSVLIWIAQGLLAVMFTMAGILKLTSSKEELAAKVGDWVQSFSPQTLRLIGLLEFLGAIGVVLPMLLGILPVLTVWATVGLCLTMLGAMAVHIQRAEYDKLGMNAVLLLLAVFVAVGRLLLVPVG